LAFRGLLLSKQYAIWNIRGSIIIIMPRHMKAFPALVELNGRTECNGIAWN
jgi:hypothetical protein